MWTTTIVCNAIRSVQRSLFEHLMEQVLAGLRLSVCLIYLHDILVPGCLFEQAIQTPAGSAPMTLEGEADALSKEVHHHPEGSEILGPCHQQ